jgi:hypothetical protein
MSRTKNKFKEKAEFGYKKGLDRKLRRIVCYPCYDISHLNPETPWKYGKPERDHQTDRLKGLKKANTGKFRAYLKRDAARKIREELEE